MQRFSSALLLFHFSFASIGRAYLTWHNAPRKSNVSLQLVALSQITAIFKSCSKTPVATVVVPFLPSIAVRFGKQCNGAGGLDGCKQLCAHCTLYYTLYLVVHNASISICCSLLLAFTVFLSPFFLSKSCGYLQLLLFFFAMRTHIGAQRPKVRHCFSVNTSKAT